ncbi:hypothetical protein [Streptomyces sp. MUM 178J]|uniref:hypothetical protein n=1 Tax=Streptomyces sp. MUM 178J TaxID=2791991 RepID=UPI001F03E4C0|nr:hypothetical protein [Streptomyces sp. MUM 178J]WRQ80632.1 hypothetical protein I3F59_015405 [Streptomyces sp. MUM 178J]
MTGRTDGGHADAHVEELEFLTHKEATVRFSAGFGADRRLPGRPHLLGRTVTLGTGWTVQQHRLPRFAQDDPHAYTALEREVSAAVTLERRYGSEPYGEVFTRLVGFDLDAPEPFVLYRAHGGEPLRARRGALTVDEQHRVLAQLVLAVRLLEHAGLVHRGIAPDAVRWDGRHVRLAEPYGALRGGEPRSPFGQAPWASPEQREGAGTADARDDLWAVAQVMYFLLSGRADQGAGPPQDLSAYRRLAALDQGGVFAPRAAARPAPAELLRLLNAPDPLAAAPAAGDPLGPARGDFDVQLARKRRDLGLATHDEPVEHEPPPPQVSSLRRSLRSLWEAVAPPQNGALYDVPAEPPPPVRDPMCPHCLLPVAYDESMLITLSPEGERIPLDLSAEHRPAIRQDALRKAYHRCPHADPARPHELPVPYLTNGEPLSIALVGSSGVGKTHLLATMLGEIEQGGLEPYGLKCLPLNPVSHRTFLRERVQNLHQGKQLAPTGQQSFARFADGLLVSGGGQTRPVVFFDLAGEDLAEEGEVTGFLMGVGAFIFVLDPLRALRLPSLDPARERNRLRRRDLGDEAFTTVLNRMPRNGRYVDAPAAVAVNKSDLLRFDPTVDRWLGRALPPRFDAEAVREESRDAYALIAQHATTAWLKPFDDCARCALHFVAATGGEAKGDVFPHGVRPRRVLAPLLSIFAMAGILPGADPGEAGL